MSNLTNELHRCRHYAAANQMTEAEMWLGARLYELEHLSADEYQVTSPERAIISDSERALRHSLANALTFGPETTVDTLIFVIERAGYAIVRR